MDKNTNPNEAVSRRKLITNTVAAASALPVVGALAGESTQAGQTNQNAQGARKEPRPQTPPQNELWQGGTGPISVLLIDMDHPFDRDPYFDLFDSLGTSSIGRTRSSLRPS
jgi:hypothetical protein